MIEKRSFMLGFKVGSLSNKVLTNVNWRTEIEKFCKGFNMTPPDDKERVELAEFLEYVLKIWEKRMKDG